MGKPTIIIWGGFFAERNDPLQLQELNSHASVTCYFLSEALAELFDVVQISSFFQAEQILQHPDAVATISTFQAGFTRLGRDAPDSLRKVRNNFPGKLCSVLDLVSFQSYAEDILFTVRQPPGGLKNQLKRLRTGARSTLMGWCASANHCKPQARSGPATVFLDHAHYSGEDHTALFVDALNLLSERSNIPPFRVLYQGNDGICDWPLSRPWHDQSYNCASKVPWIELIHHYAQSDLFCVTHRESAGLAPIEAAMSGAKVIVPTIDTPFIAAELLATGFAHRVAGPHPALQALLVAPLAESFSMEAHASISVPSTEKCSSDSNPRT